MYIVWYIGTISCNILAECIWQYIGRCICFAATHFRLQIVRIIRKVWRMNIRPSSRVTFGSI